jgi:hypothetical protein
MARPPLYITRSDLDWSSTSPAEGANPRSGLVIHYDSVDQGLASKPLSASLDYWRRTRAFHTGPSRGWDDIGYSFLATAQGHIVEGRGLHKAQAAQPGGNTSHYSVTLATGPNDTITPEQINAVRALRQWLMQDHHVAGAVLGHRDFISTSCPGEKAYALVRSGTFEQAPGPITEVSDMLGLGLDSKGEAVKLLQVTLKNAGFADAVGDIDGHYGPQTAEAVRLARKSVGSKALPGYGDKMTADAVEQVNRAFARYQAQIMIDRAPASGGGGTVDPGALVGATLTTKVTKVVS